MSEQDRNLDRMLAGLDREIMPGRDLWPGIERAMRDPRQGFWQWRLAASVAAASVLIGLLIYQPDRGADRQVAAAAPEPVPMVDPALFRHTGFEPAFIVEHERALAQLADQLDTLPPGTREIVIGNLQIIRASIGEINAAIEREPNNVQLRQLLQVAYRQEIAIVSNIRESANTLRRTSI